MAPQVKLKSGIERNVTTKIASPPVKAKRLMVWGDDSAHQISNAPQEKIKAVAGGSFNGLALRLNNTPVLWGAGPAGPSQDDAKEFINEKFRAIAIGRDDAVMINQNQTLAAFGKNLPVIDVPSGKFQAVTVAGVHAVAIAKDGTLKTWGTNSYPPTSDPLALGGPFKEVAARVSYSLALHKNGTLYGWGNGSGVGYNIFNGWTPTTDDANIFYLPGLEFKAIAAGNQHALAIRSDGTVTGWGNGTGGALNTPPHVLFDAVAAGWGFSIGLSPDGTLWGWGTPHKLPVTQQWTFDTEGWTRYNDTEHYFFPDVHFKSIAAAAFHIMAITAGS